MKRFFYVLLGIVLVASGAATVGTDSYLKLLNNTAAPITQAAPNGQAFLWVENGSAKLKVGTSVTNVGSGSGSGEWKQVWPPSSISNPSVGTKTIGPLIVGYLPDSVFQTAEYTPKGWRYETLRSGPF